MYVLLLTTWGWNIPQRRGHSGFWSNQLRHCYHFTAHWRCGLLTERPLLLTAHKFMMVMVHPKLNISGAWGLSTTSSSKPVGYIHGFPIPLLQALIKRHKAKCYFLPLGMKGGPTETLGWGKQIQYNFTIWKRCSHVPPKRSPTSTKRSFLQKVLQPGCLRKRTMLISNAPWMAQLNCDSMTPERRLGLGVRKTGWNRSPIMVPATKCQLYL